MRYRRLNFDRFGNNIYTFGMGDAGVIEGNDAVAQAVVTRLKLWEGDWWEQVDEGLPFMTLIRGFRPNNQSDVQRVALLVQNIIRRTPSVLRCYELETTFDRDTRTLRLRYRLVTEFTEEIILNVGIEGNNINVEVA